MINKITRKHPHQRSIQLLIQVTDNSNKLIRSAIITNYNPFNLYQHHQSEECKQNKKLLPLKAFINQTLRPHNLCPSQEIPSTHQYNLYPRLWKYSLITNSCQAYSIQALKQKIPTFQTMDHSSSQHRKREMQASKQKVAYSLISLRCLLSNDQ